MDVGNGADTWGLELGADGRETILDAVIRLLQQQVLTIYRWVTLIADGRKEPLRRALLMN